MNTFRKLVIAGTLCAQTLGISSVALAQKARSSTTKAQQARLVAVRVEGSKNLTDADVIAYTGLQIGEVVGPQQFSDAADKLSACGAFDEVRYRYEPAGQGYRVTFAVVDSQQLVPVTFDNFVWFSDAELNEQVRKTVPLFRGTVPTGGDMLQQVTDALQAFVASRGVQGTVRFEQEGGGDEQGNATRTGVMFTVDGVEFKVRGVSFPGAAEADLQVLQKASRDIFDTDYHKKTVQSWAANYVQPFYAERGFLKASIGNISTQLINPDSKVPQVAISVPVEPGPRYSLAAVRWTGVKSLRVEELETLVTVKNGAVANSTQLQSDLDRVKAAYASKGYLRAELESRPSFNDAERMVAYDVQVREGDVYRFKGIDLDGLDSEKIAKLRAEWTLREGEPFDAGYERKYLETIRPMLAPNISVSVDKELDDEAKTVEVSMHFITHAAKIIQEKRKE